MGYYFLAIGAVISTLGLWAVINSLKLLLLGVRTQGVIVGVDEQMRRGDSQRKKVYFHPVVEFETAQGYPFQFTFGSGSSWKRPVIGSRVSVVYEAGRPEKATLNSFLGLWAGPLAAALLGGGLLFGGAKLVFFGPA